MNGVGAVPEAREPDPTLRLTILYDNTSLRSDLQADWGFSLMVEAKGAPRILFDTGGSGRILLENMERLGFAPTDVAEVFISHAHYDHTGGLSAVLDANPEIEVFAPPSFRGVRRARSCTHLSEPTEIHPGVLASGELAGIEQFLAVRTGRGVAMITGCSHPPMADMMEVAEGFGRVFAVVGGLHGFAEYELFEDLELVCPTHCTRHVAEIAARFPDRYLPGGIGRRIDM